MDSLQRLTAWLCGKLPGKTGLACYVICCVLPRRGCIRLFKARRYQTRSYSNAATPDADEHMPILGFKRVLLLGFEGAGKTAFLWMCEHPLATELPQVSDVHQPTGGVFRLTRKGVLVPGHRYIVDLDLSEVGGGKLLRPYWSQYITRDVDVLAFLVDASTPDQLEEVATQFGATCAVARAAAPFARVVLIATRVGAPNAMAASEVHARVRRWMPESVDGNRVVFSELEDLRGPSAQASADALLHKLARLAVC